MKPSAVSNPIHKMSERPACPRCRQPVMVIEIEDTSSDNSTPAEQQIVCPQCGGFISALLSLKRVLAYPAPVGDYYDEAGLGNRQSDEVQRKPVESASPGERRRRA